MKVLQINSVCGYGSTGRIAADIADVLISNGYECKIGYGRKNVPDAYKKIAVRIGTNWDITAHGIKTRLYDAHGFAGKTATKRFIRWVKEYNPDIVHLHNIHGYYIHTGALFDYLRQSGKPVIWTLHDCWAFTGHCAYFSAAGCEQWKNGCGHCLQKAVYPSCMLFGNAKKNYARKRAAFAGLPNMTLVTPSYWLAELVRQSFLKDYPVKVIHNGIDLSVFYPVESAFRRQYGLEKKKIILGAASEWTERKGLRDFLELAAKLDDTFQIVLVGVSPERQKKLPSNILGIPRTNSAGALAEIYSAADVLLNPTKEDNFPTVNLEAMACGIPVITYPTGGSPEAIGDCGMTVTQGDISSIKSAINKCIEYISREECVRQAQAYRKEDRYLEYITLYQTALNKE